MDLILHCGAPKVGSSSIQAFLTDHVDQLLDSGIAVLDRSMVPYPHHGKGFHAGPTPALGGFLSGRTSDQAFREVVLRALDLADRQGCKALIWSSENLCRMRGDRTRERLHGFLSGLSNGITLHGVMYMRRQDGWLEAAWKQWDLKVERRPAFAWARDTIAAGRVDFLAECLAWERLCGPGRFHLGLLDKALLDDGHLIPDFCGKIGWPCPAGTDLAAYHVNYSVDGVLLDFFHRYNWLLFENQADHRLFNAVYRSGLGRRQDKRGTFTEDERRWIVAHFADENRRIVERFFPERRDEALRYLGVDDAGPERPVGAAPTATAPTTEQMMDMLGAGLALNLALTVELSEHVLHMSRRRVRPKRRAGSGRPGGTKPGPRRRRRAGLLRRALRVFGLERR